MSRLASCQLGDSASWTAKRRLRNRVVASSIEPLERRWFLATIQWIGGNGDWDVPGNWDLDRSPNSADTVVIPEGATVNVNTAGKQAQIVNSLGLLRVNSSGSVQFTNGGTLANVDLLGGTLDLGYTGSKSIAGTFNWSGGTLSGTGVLNLTGQGNFTSSSVKTLGTALNVVGSVTHSGSGSLHFASGAVDIIIPSGATYDIAGDADFTADVNAFGAALQISGTLRKSGAGESIFNPDNRPLEFLLTGGTIDAQAGTLRVAHLNGISRGGAMNASQGALVRFEGANNYWGGKYTGSGAGRIEFASGILYSYYEDNGLEFDFPGGLFHFVGGTLQSSSPSYPIVNTGTMQISGDSGKSFTGTPVNKGVMILSGAGTLGLNNAGLNIESGGVLELSDGTSIQSGTITNSGTLRKLAGNGTATLSNQTVLHHLGSTVQVLGGMLRTLGSGNSENATFQVSPGASFDLTESAGLYWKGTFVGSGGGQVLLDSGAITSSGELDLNFAEGMFHFGAAYLAADGGRIRNVGYFQISGDGGRTTRASIENAGIVRQNFTGGLNNYGFGSFKNLPGAIWEISGAGTIDFSPFENLGTIRKIGGGASSFNTEVTNRSGAKIEVTAGTLDLARGGHYYPGAFDVTAGGVLRFSGGALHRFYDGQFSNNGTGIVRFAGPIYSTGTDIPIFNFQGNTLELDDGASFNGAFTFAGTTNLVANTGVFFRSDGTTAFRNTGTFNHSGTGVLGIYVTTSLSNEGTYNVTSDGDFQIYGVNVGSVQAGIINTGVFRKSAGTGVSELIDPSNLAVARFSNLGTVEALSGTLRLGERVEQLTRQGTSIAAQNVLTGGKWMVGPSAALELPGGTNIAPGAILPPIQTNAGDVTLSGNGSVFSQLASMTMNTGNFTVGDGRQFASAGALVNSGVLRARSGGRITVNGALNNSGTLAFGVEGTSASGNFGRMDVTGTATLAGTAAIELDPGFAPSPADVYTVMTFLSRNGGFASITGEGTAFTSTLDDTSFKLNASAVATPVNLAVVPGSITLPLSAEIGSSITVSYSVLNDSTTNALGSWTDSLYLSRDQSFDSSDILLGRVERTGGLVAGDSYTQQVDFTVPGVPDDDYFLVVLTDSKRQVPQTERANDLAASTGTLSTSVPELIYGQTFNSSIANGQSRYFRLPQPRQTDAQLLANFTVSAQAELYISRGTLPTRAEFGITSSDLYALTRTIDLTVMTDFDYYILVYGREGAGASQTPFSLRADKINIQVQTASPNTTGNVGIASFVLSGLGFSPDTSATLIAPDGTELPATVVFSEKTTSISAAFDLAGVAAGKYAIRVTRPDGATHTLADAITVLSDAKPGRAYATVAAPGNLRAARQFEFVVEYGNDGGSDVIAPWLTIGVTPGTKWRLKGGDYITARHWDILGASPDGLAGVLRPGQRVRLTFEATWESGNAPDIQVWGATDRQRLTPEAMIELYGGTPGEGRWVAAAQRLAQQFGSTLESYATELATLASRKSQFGFFERDVNTLVRSAVFLALLDTAPEPQGVIPGDGSTSRTLPTDEAYVEYDKDPSTNGDGARLPDGRWTPWVPAREPTIVELAEAGGDVEIRKHLIGGWFGFREEWYEWINAWREGTGKPWVATSDSRIAKQILEFLQGVGSSLGDQTAQVWEKLDELITFQSAPFTDIPQGTTTYRYMPNPKTFYVELAEKAAPKFGDVKWSFGGTTLAVGRTPAGNDVGFDVDLTRYNLSAAGDIVLWRAQDIPMRVEDNFTIDEHVVNRAAKRNGKPAFKNDLGFYYPFYILETFGDAKGLKWYVNMILPLKEGKVALAGVEANAGPSQTIYIPAGQTTARVQLQGDGAFIRSNRLSEAEGPSFVWTGLAVDPADVQFPEMDLPKGTYFFNLTVRGKGEPNSPYPNRQYEDTDLVMITVLDESDKPAPVASTARPRPVQSSDPNDITGPVGYSQDNYVTPQQGFPYTIRFENIATATAPAQDVFITQQLGSDLDWTTFELGSFGFGGMQFDVPEGLSSYNTTLDLTSELGLLVDVEAGLNPLTGEVKWTFRSIDPQTGDLVSDPLAGFLPPNAASPEGEGFVRYFIQQKSGLPSGRPIDAQASIIFDVNAPIDTNTWRNIIDADAPTSQMSPLSVTQGSTTFNVSWAGNDGNGSGIAMYDVYVSENGGPFTLFRDNTTATSAAFTGVNGSTYAFYSVATDNVGFVQQATGNAQATTRISLTSTPGNRAPVAKLTAPAMGVRGQHLTFKLAATDPDAGDAAVGFTYKIDFGDGTKRTISPKANNGAGVNIDYVYRNKGNFKITLTATDRKGIVSSVVSRTICVAAVAMLTDPTNSSRKALFVGGTSGKDTIRFDKAGPGRIKLTINGVSQGLLSPSGRIFAFGQAGDDLILIAPDVPTNVVFFGNDGNDILHGGSGMNALFGGAGKDSIYGHGGRDIVIGGSGKDLLKGDGSGDIFIGGSTSYDSGSTSHLAAISNLLDAWNTSDSYEKRIARIRAGVGPGMALFSSATVKDDNAKDDMHGGTGLDWFFARTNGANKDQIHSAKGEIITRID